MSPMRRTKFEVRMPDGRRLIAELSGPEDGVLLVSHAGTPGTRFIYERHLREGADRGLRHLSYSRPGYEGSDRLPGRCIADCVPDVVALVDHLGVDTFHVAGNSGGAPHALACAALLPTRVLSAAVVSCFTPRYVEGIDWMAGMGAPNVEEYTALEAGDAELEEEIERLKASFLDPDENAVTAAFDDCLADSDRECLVQPFEEITDDAVARSVSAGIWGWFDDDKATYMDWGFDLSQIEVPLTLWHGSEDRFVPPTHGEWLARQLPSAPFHLLQGEGHIAMYERNYGPILDELLALRA